MAPKSKYLFIASMDVDPAKEALFHEVYNTEHCPELGKIAGVGEITRFEAQAFQVLIGGQTQTISPDGQPRFHAMYEIESPEVLSSPAWGEAVELGRWPEQVRPDTTNRRPPRRRRSEPEEKSARAGFPVEIEG
jgi:hypothetical protein